MKTKTTSKAISMRTAVAVLVVLALAVGAWFVLVKQPRQNRPGDVAPTDSAAVAVQPAAPAATVQQTAAAPNTPVAVATTVPAATSVPSEVAKPGDVIPWEDLPKFVDRHFELTTSHMAKRDVLLVAASAEEITVMGSVAGGGRVQNRVYRDGFGKAVLIR